jgi:hypothetical protein
MKLSSPENRTFRIATLFLLFCFTLIGFTRSYGGTYIVKKHLPGDSIYIQKNFISKSHKINLYPDAQQKVVFFNVRGIEGKVYQLYVFDLEGKLVKQTETRNKQTTLLRNIEKGIYLFEIFSDDLRIGNGQIAVR